MLSIYQLASQVGSRMGIFFHRRLILKRWIFPFLIDTILFLRTDKLTAHRRRIVHTVPKFSHKRKKEKKKKIPVF